MIIIAVCLRYSVSSEQGPVFQVTYLSLPGDPVDLQKVLSYGTNSTGGGIGASLQLAITH